MDWVGARGVPFLARGNYVLEMQHILAWGVVVGIVEGSFASVVAAKTFGAGPILISVAATTPFAAHIASLLWGVLCDGRRKIHLFTLLVGAVAMLTASIALTPHSRAGAVLFVVQMAAAQFFMSGTVTVRSALWRANYPADLRGRITARIQKVRAVLRLVAVAVAAIIFDYQPTAYRWFYPLVALLAVVAVLPIRRMRVRGERSELHRRQSCAAQGAVAQTAPPFPGPGQVLGRVVRVMRRDERFRRYMTAQFVTGSANFLVRAVVILLVTKHLLVNMKAEYWVSTMLLDGLTMTVMLVSMSPFAVYFDRVGVLRFRVVHAILWTVALAWGLGATLAYLYADRIGPMYLPIAVSGFALFSITRGVCMGAGSLAWNLGHLHFARSADAEVYMGIHVSLTGLRGLVMPGLGMLLWEWIGWGVWILAIALSITALAMFASMVRRERATAREYAGAPGDPPVPAECPPGLGPAHQCTKPGA